MSYVPHTSTHTHTRCQCIRGKSFSIHSCDRPKCLIHRKWHIDSNQWHGNFLLENSFCEIECIHTHAEHTTLLRVGLVHHRVHKINNINNTLDGWTLYQHWDAVDHRCSCYIVSYRVTLMWCRVNRNGNFNTTAHPKRNRPDPFEDTHTDTLFIARKRKGLRLWRTDNERRNDVDRSQ